MFEHKQDSIGNSSSRELFAPQGLLGSSQGMPKASQDTPVSTLVAKCQCCFAFSNNVLNMNYCFPICSAFSCKKNYFSNYLRLPKAPLDPKEAPGELPGGPKESPRARLGTLWRSRELSSTPQRQLFGPNVRGRHPAGANRRCRVGF